MNTRIVFLTIACGVGLLSFPAQRSAAQGGGQASNWTPPKLQPFTGHVFDQETGKPIAGAEVHYLDDNPPMDMNRRPVRGFTSGMVMTGPDGSYTLPADLPMAAYKIRIVAPGYYAYRFYDSQLMVGEEVSTEPQRPPSHEIHLLHNNGLVAIGASQLPGIENKFDGSFTSVAISPAGDSLVAAANGPGLWVVTLSDGHVRRIDLPDAVTAPNTSISQVGWDGTNLLFLAATGFDFQRSAVIGSASAPDFHVALLPAPNPSQVDITMTSPTAGDDRFKIEEGSACDQDPSPHCGQGGSLVAHDTQTGRTVTLLQAEITDLSYLQDKMGGGLIAYAEETPPADVATGGMNSVDRYTPGITLVNLDTGIRTHIQLPGRGGNHLQMVAERMIRAGGTIQAMRVAYTTEGDCDPASTDLYPPSSPDGGVGHTPNNWSLCVVSVPLPPLPAREALAANGAGKCGNVSDCNQLGTEAIKSNDTSRAVELFKQQASLAEAGHNSAQIVLAYNNLAIAYMHSKDYTNALDAVHHALSIDSQSASAKYNLQLIEKAMGGRRTKR